MNKIHIDTLKLGSPVEDLETYLKQYLLHRYKVQFQFLDLNDCKYDVVIEWACDGYDYVHTAKIFLEAEDDVKLLWHLSAKTN